MSGGSTWFLSVEWCVADQKLVYIYNIHDEWNPRSSYTDQASNQLQEEFPESDQQQEWGIDSYLCSCRKEFFAVPILPVKNMFFATQSIVFLCI